MHLGMQIGMHDTELNRNSYIVSHYRGRDSYIVKWRQGKDALRSHVTAESFLSRDLLICFLHWGPESRSSYRYIFINMFVNRYRLSLQTSSRIDHPPGTCVSPISTTSSSFFVLSRSTALHQVQREGELDNTVLGAPQP
jgi:hypothetical protein